MSWCFISASSQSYNLYNKRATYIAGVDVAEFNGESGDLSIIDWDIWKTHTLDFIFEIITDKSLQFKASNLK